MMRGKPFAVACQTSSLLLPSARSRASARTALLRRLFNAYATPDPFSTCARRRNLYSCPARTILAVTGPDDRPIEEFHPVGAGRCPEMLRAHAFIEWLGERSSIRALPPPTITGQCHAGQRRQCFPRLRCILEICCRALQCVSAHLFRLTDIRARFAAGSEPYDSDAAPT